MMRILIAVKSCQRDRILGYHNIIRNTWGKDIPENVDLRFFVGDRIMEDSFLKDEVVLSVPDGYISLPIKTASIVKYSLDKDYDYTFLCDTDTFIIPRLLFKCGFERFDYSGRFGAMPAIGTTFHYRDAHGDYPKCHPWASGGVGYFLSKKACRIIAGYLPDVWAEDLWVGQVLGPYIQNRVITASDLPIECVSAWHFPRRQYNNEPYNPKYKWMETMYADHN